MTSETQYILKASRPERLLTVVLVLLSLIISSKTSLKLFTKVVRHPGLKSELGFSSSTSTESKLSWELRSSSYNARNSSCASFISFFSCKRDEKVSLLQDYNKCFSCCCRCFLAVIVLAKAGLQPIV